MLMKWLFIVVVTLVIAVAASCGPDEPPASTQLSPKQVPAPVSVSVPSSKYTPKSTPTLTSTLPSTPKPSSKLPPIRIPVSTSAQYPLPTVEPTPKVNKEELPSLKWKINLGSASDFVHIQIRDTEIDVPSSDGYLYTFDRVTGDLHWKFNVGKYPQQPILSGGTLFVGGYNRISALDPTSGSPKWEIDTPGGGGTPLVVGNILIVQYGSSVYGLDAVNGLVKWKYHTYDSMGMKFYLVNGMVLFHSGIYMYALKPSTGELYWKSEVGDWQTFETVATTNSAFYYYKSDSEELYALNLSDGRNRWVFNVSQVTSRTVDVTPSLVYLNPWNTKYILVLDATTGQLVATFKTDIPTNSFVYIKLYGSRLFAGWYGGVIALDSSSGALEWSFHQGPNVSDPFVTNDTLYLGGDTSSKKQGKYSGWNRYIYALNIATGQLKWSLPIESWQAESGQEVQSMTLTPHPIVEGGIIYFTATDNQNSVRYLFAYNEGVAGTAGVAIAWAKRVSQQFKSKVIEISSRLNVDANYLMAAMAFETGGTFDSAITNSVSGATGLIQFLPSTARNLGITTDALRAMSAVEQLDYVEKYFLPYRGRLTSLEDLYMAILWPKAIGQSPDYALFVKPSIEYEQNRGLDMDGDGKVTKAEASVKVRDSLTEGLTSLNKG